MDHNKSLLVGRLTKDPKFFPAGYKGEEHCTFILAVNRVVAGAKGPEADYIPCSLWGTAARSFVENRGKGDEVGIKGRIRTNHVQQADGSSLPYFEIRVEEFQLGRRSLRNLQPKPASTPATEAVGRLQGEFGND